MKKRKYENFDELFYNINREVLLEPNKMIDFNSSIMGMIENLMISVNSSECHLDLSKFGYMPRKWTHLVKTYVNYDEFLKFQEKLKTSSSFSLTFHFNEKKINNGSCLIALVFTRQNRKKEWTRVNVLYRTTELQRRFAADLVLIHTMLNELPECCKIEKINFYMPLCYSNAMFVNGCLDYFNVNVKELDSSNKWIKSLLSVNKNYFSKDSKDNNYQSLRKMQQLAKGTLKVEPIDINKLSIKQVFVKEEK